MTSPTPSEVRAAREAAGLTLDQAAALVHCHRMTWWKWEQGAKVDPARWELFALKAKRLKAS